MAAYEGNDSDTCPQRGGAYCRKVCPTCKAYRQFWRDENGVRVAFHDCSLLMQSALQIENNALLVEVLKRLEKNQAATEGLRNVIHDAENVAEAIVTARAVNLAALPRPPAMNAIANGTTED